MFRAPDIEFWRFSCRCARVALEYEPVAEQDHFLSTLHRTALHSRGRQLTKAT